MNTYDYVIVGGGMVADAAARGIRERDESGEIVILSADIDEPYTRPALSKKLWTDDAFTDDQVPLGTADDTGAQIRLRTLVAAIDPAAHAVETADGARIGYRRLLLATGSTPQEVGGGESDRVLYFRSAADYRRLRELAADGARIVVVGGGYIGSEIAAALVQNGVEVDLVFPGAVLGDDTFPADLAERYQSLFADAGVHLVPGRRADDVRGDDAGAAVVLDDGRQLRASAAVVGLGVAPVTDLAEEAGLTVDDGVIVDERLRTSEADIWAAGDIAAYPDPVLGRTRVEHVDNATEMGAAAGRSMAGAEEPYAHTPYFYSAVFGVRWEAVGSLDPELDTAAVEVGDSRVVAYLGADGAPVGVLMWDVSDDNEPAREAARAVIADGVSDPDELRRRFAMLA
ncbi:NAD(P)/FAD-dependent oxidoreductase [Microbacterium sp. NPDC091313]